MKEVFMNAAIRQAKAKTGAAEELARGIKEGAIPIISDAEGFMAHYVIYARHRDSDPRLQQFRGSGGGKQASARRDRTKSWALLLGPATAVAGLVIVQGGQQRPDQIRLRYYNPPGS
jgi:hypothetical protein